MTSPIQYHFITPIYNGEPLSLLQEAPTSLDQNKHPIVLSPPDMQGMDFPSVLRILKGRVQLPSAVTEVGYGQMRSPVIEDIDHIYKRALREYKACFHDGVKKDERNIKPLDEQLDQQIDQANYTPRYIIGGTILGLIGGIPIGAMPGYFLGKWIDTRKRERNILIKKEVLQQQSAHRRVGLQVIDNSEKKRYSEMKNMICLRLETILQTLKELAERDDHKQSDFILQQEIYYLSLIYKDVFPNEPPLVIDGTNIDEYLEKEEIDGSIQLRFDLLC